MKRRVLLSTINAIPLNFALSVEFLAAKIYSEPQLRHKIRLIKKVFPQKTPKNKVLQQILAHSPHMVGFSCYVWNITKILELASAIKKNSPETLIVLGGPETEGQNILKEYSYIDGVVMGEGEEAFAQMLTGWLENEKLSVSPGVAVRQGRRICIGHSRSMSGDLDKIPSPYDYLKTSGFKKSGKIGYASMSIQTLRGCNRKCFYCYYGKKLSAVRFFSLERVEKDLDKIKKAGIRTVGILDPNFFCHYGHAAGVIKLLSDKKIHFQLEVNAEDLNEKAIDLLAGSTCYQVNFGLQSSNPEVLKLCGRPCNLKKFETNIRKLAKKSPDIDLYLDLIYGLPGDTLEGFGASIDFAFSLPINIIYIFPLEALPGTLFFEQPEKWGIKFSPIPPRVVYRNKTFSSEDIKQAGMIAWTLMNLALSCGIQPVIHYIFEKISDTPSRFFSRIADWDKEGKQRFIFPGRKQLKMELNLSDFRYFLSAVKHLYPEIFPAQDLKFMDEWYRFRLYFHRLAKKSSPGENIPEVLDDKGNLWKRSNNLLMGRFRIKPRIKHETFVMQPLEKKKRRLVLQKDFKGVIRIYEISKEMEKLLIFFQKPKALNSYLTVSDTGTESVVDRHIRIQFVREKGFIHEVSQSVG